MAFGLALRSARKIPKWVRNMGQYDHGWRKAPHATGGDMREVRMCLRGPRKPMRENKRHFGRILK